MSHTTVTATIRKPYTLTVQCEDCDHIFRISSYIEAKYSHDYYHTFLGIGAEQEVRGTEAQGAREKMDALLNKLRGGDYSDISNILIACPKCGYWQSWIVAARKKSNKENAIGAVFWGVIVAFIAWVGSHIGDLVTIAVIVEVVLAIFFVVSLLKYGVNPNGNRRAPASRPPVGLTVEGVPMAVLGPNWWYQRAGDTSGRFGPLSSDEVENWVTSGRLAQEDKLSPDGTTEWTAVTQWLAARGSSGP